MRRKRERHSGRNGISFWPDGCEEMVMYIGFTETERIIIVLAELLYCLAYTYAAWYFMKRNHRVEEIPHIIRIPTVLILFFS